MYEELEEKKNSGIGIFEIQKIDEKRSNLIIYEQRETGFEYEIYFRKNEIAKRYSSTCDFRVRIMSCSCTEIYCDDNSIDLYLQGDNDFGETSIITFRNEYSEKIEMALKRLGGIFVNDINDNEKDKVEKIDMSLKDDIKIDEDEEKIIDEMISKVDINTFMKIIYNRASLTMPLAEVNKRISLNDCKEYLRRWAISKMDLYIALGRNLKIEKEIEAEKDMNYFVDKYNEIKNKFPLYLPMLEIISMDDINDNTYHEYRSSAIFRKIPQVENGMKITKLISLYGNNELDIEFSKMYQEKGTQTIAISIDPLDYLTVSINGSGWKSCHNFFNGAYSDAPISYMFDETSMVAYAYSSVIEYNHIVVPFKHNSKKWRQMIYVDKNSSSVVFSREYPFKSEQNKEEIRKMYEETICQNLGWKNNWYIYKNAGIRNIKVSNLNYVYNDIKNGYEHMAIINKFDNKLKLEKEIVIGVEHYERLGGY